MQTPKVLVGCPTSKHKAYCLNDYAEAVKRLDYPNYDILLVDNSETDDYMKKIHDMELPVIKGPYDKDPMKRIVDSRNLLVKMAINGKYDYFLSLEQDVIPPRTIIKDLLAADKEVITGVYCKPWVSATGKTSVVVPLIWDYFSEQDHVYLKKNIEAVRQTNPKLHKILSSSDDYQELRKRIRKPITLGQVQKEEIRRVKAAGVGCMLIKTSVLSKIPFRVNPEGFDDMTFCQDLEEQHIPLFVNTAVKCDHLVQMGQWESIQNELRK
jgi:hypothetical protein